MLFLISNISCFYHVKQTFLSIKFSKTQQDLIEKIKRIEIKLDYERKKTAHIEHPSNTLNEHTLTDHRL